MSAGKRPSTSSLRRFITSRPYVTVAELRRRFALDAHEGMVLLTRNGTSAWIGLPEREATKLQDLLDRDEVGLELSAEIRAPVVIGVYPMRIARYVIEGANGGNGMTSGNGTTGGNGTNGHPRPAEASAEQPGTSETGAGEVAREPHPRAPRPMDGAPDYGQPNRRA